MKFSNFLPIKSGSRRAELAKKRPSFFLPGSVAVVLRSYPEL